MNTELLQECKKRREQLKKMAPDSTFILASGREGHLQNFRPDSDFYYFTGFTEPHSIAVIRPSEKDSFILFVRPKDEFSELWDGFRYGVDGAKSRFDCDKTFAIDAFSQEIAQLISPTQKVYFAYGGNPTLDKVVIDAIDDAKNMPPRTGGGRLPIYDPQEITGELRVVKSSYEIQQMSEAARISVLGHRKAMSHCRPGLNERQVYSFLASGFYFEKADREGYCAIVAGGSNGTTLHYKKNDEDIPDDSLILIDAGAEFGFYTADITRTFPISGKFSPEQKDIYQSVLEVQKRSSKR